VTDPDRIETARRAVRRERRRTVDEREAFAAFRSAVREVPAERGRPAVRTAARGLATGGAGTIRTVHEAYGRTVMSVPHYDEEYGDTLAESLEVEFGATIAAGLLGHDRLTPELKRAVVEAAEASRLERERFVEALDAETVSLRESEERLVAVLEEVRALADEPIPDFGAQDAVRARLGVLADECDAVADDRQATVREWHDRFAVPGDVPTLPGYLYAGLDTHYPVLATVAEVGEHVTRLRRRVERAMAEPATDGESV
jgi:hypothetical protein